MSKGTKLTDRDWAELRAAYEMLTGTKNEFDFPIAASRVDTRLDSGAMSAIYRCGSVVRIDIKESK